MPARSELKLAVSCSFLGWDVVPWHVLVLIELF